MVGCYQGLLPLCKPPLRRVMHNFLQVNSISYISERKSDLTSQGNHFQLLHFLEPTAFFFFLVQLAKRLGQDVFKSSQSRAVFRETDGPPKVKKLLSCGERPGGLFTSSSRKAGMRAGKINTTYRKGMPQMNRITGSEPGGERHRPAPGRLRELVTHI